MVISFKTSLGGYYTESEDCTTEQEEQAFFDRVTARGDKIIRID